MAAYEDGPVPLQSFTQRVGDDEADALVRSRGGAPPIDSAWGGVHGSIIAAVVAVFLAALAGAIVSGIYGSENLGKNNNIVDLVKITCEKVVNLTFGFEMFVDIFGDNMTTIVNSMTTIVDNQGELNSTHQEILDRLNDIARAVACNCTAIRQCDIPLVINENGFRCYEIVDDLTCSVDGAGGDACIRVVSGDILIKGNDFTLTGDGNNRMVRVFGANTRLAVEDLNVANPTQALPFYARGFQAEFGATLKLRNVAIGNMWSGVVGFDLGTSIEVIGCTITGSHNQSIWFGQVTGISMFGPVVRVINTTVAFDEIPGDITSFGITHNAAAGACGTAEWSDVSVTAIAALDFHCGTSGVSVNNAVAITPDGVTEGATPLQIGIVQPVYGTFCDISITMPNDCPYCDGVLVVSPADVTIHNLNIAGGNDRYPGDNSSAALFHILPNPRGNPDPMQLFVSNFEFNAVTPNEAAILNEAWFFGPIQPPINATFSHGTINVGPNGFGYFADNLTSGTSLKDVEINGGYYGVYLENGTEYVTLNCSTPNNDCVGLFADPAVGPANTANKNDFINVDTALDIPVSVDETRNVDFGAGPVCGAPPALPFTLYDSFFGGGGAKKRSDNVGHRLPDPIERR